MGLIKLYIGILIAFVIGAIVVAGILICTFKKGKSIDLVQGKLANSDSSIADAVSYLKLTNEWSSTDATN